MEHEARDPERARLRWTSSPQQVQSMTSHELRRSFLLEDLFTDGQINWTFTELDRLAIGGAAPATTPLMLPNPGQTGADFFLARREMGVINIGGPGLVRVDGQELPLDTLDCAYVATGSRAVELCSDSAARPARFYLVSCPSHHAHTSGIVRRRDCAPIALGAPSMANRRQILQYIHAGGIRSSQLVMGLTELAEGSVWNTMPPHTHTRRTEVYFYFDLSGDNLVAHFLGPPEATRHVFVRNEQAVLSPSWSVHAGCGTSSYKFIWAMAGENQAFDDMDKVELRELR